MINYLYYFGLILVIIYILMGFDDFVWDVIILIRKLFGRDRNKDLDLKEVDIVPKKLIAIMIAAWHEDNVIEEVLEHFVSSTLYPKDQFHIFVGVYPNDELTINAMKNISQKHSNIHYVINEKEGPTTKAQNLNYVVKQILEFEKEKGWKFQSFTVHDAEDVVHSFELQYTNYIMNKSQAIQFPVFPLIKYPTFGNFFKYITANTYADEFAENHYLTMVNRNSVGAFVPSAGTGFALRRDVIESFDNYNFLPEDSLTEDYKLAYELYKKNIKMHYVLDKVPYINDKLKVKHNLVATRSMFPNTFKTAVRQKKRWITGITMQSIEFKDVFQKNGLSLAGRYSIYRDQKAKIGNLIAFIGYPVFIYYILSLFIDLPVIYPKYSTSWYLSLLVTVMMIERLIFRSISIYKVYGLKSLFFSTMFPPLLPIRYIWGNFINFVATFEAYLERFRGQKEKKEKKVKNKKLKWDKTEHFFLETTVLKRYYNKAGDLLLKRGYIEPKDLKKALKKLNQDKSNKKIGTYLLENRLISEEQLARVLADLDGSVFIEIDNLARLFNSDSLYKLKVEEFKKYKAVPFYIKDNTLAVAISHKFTPEDRIEFEKLHKNIEINWCYALENTLMNTVETIYENDKLSSYFSLYEKRINQGNLSIMQMIMATNLAYERKIPPKDALMILGLDR